LQKVKGDSEGSETKTAALTELVVEHQEQRTLQADAMQMQGEAMLHSCIDKQCKMVEQLEAKMDKKGMLQRTQSGCIATQTAISQFWLPNSLISTAKSTKANYKRHKANFYKASAKLCKREAMEANLAANRDS
jgi:hypothetical protein